MTEGYGSEIIIKHGAGQALLNNDRPSTVQKWKIAKTHM